MGSEASRPSDTPGNRLGGGWVSSLFPWLLLILLAGFVLIPTLQNPVEEHSYDAATFHVYRGVLFSDARAGGVFYPYWIQPINAGLGGPLFSFYPPLTYYALDGLHVLGLPHPIAWRVLLGLAMLLASAGVFALIQELTGAWMPALAAGAVFLYSFPVLRELLERGAPEGFAVALYPWSLWGLARFIKYRGGLNLAIAALIWAALILTHQLAALFLLPVLALLGLLCLRRRDRWPVVASMLVIGVGLALSAIFGLPFLVDRGAVRLDNVVSLEYAQVVQNAVRLRDLLAIPAAYDIGLGNNSIGEHIGPLVALILVVGLLAGAFHWVRRRCWAWLATACFSLLGLAVVWLQTPSSDAVWKALPALAYVQIRTRLLGVAALCAAVVVGLALAEMRGRWRAGLSAAVVCIALVVALPVLYPQLQYRYVAFEKRPSASDAAAFALRENVPGLTAFNEFLPVWRYLPFTADEAQRVAWSLLTRLPAGARVTAEERGASFARAQVESPVPFDAVFHVLYYPGWAGFVDGQRHDLLPAEGTGYTILKEVPPGRHTIELRYEGTPAQRVGTWISGLALLGLMLAAIRWRGTRGVSERPSYSRPYWWLVGGILLLLAAKTLLLDPHTTFLRRVSSCAIPPTTRDSAPQKAWDFAAAGAAGDAQVTFGREIRLCGVDLPSRGYRPGEPLRVILYWQVDQAVEQPAVSFVHLLGTAFNPRTNNPLWGQQDKELPGDHQLTKWAPGKIYRDTYEFQIDPGAPPGQYQLEIGWFQPASGRRLAPEQAGTSDRMRLSDLDSLIMPGIVVR